MKYKSEIYKALHEDFTAHFKMGTISKAEMREFEKRCFIHEPKASYAPEKPRKAGYAAAGAR